MQPHEESGKIRKLRQGRLHDKAGFTLGPDGEKKRKQGGEYFHVLLSFLVPVPVDRFQFTG